MYLLSLVREQDVRELNQADLTEVDPEENSAEFMGILIKVHTRTLLNNIDTVRSQLQHLVLVAILVFLVFLDFKFLYPPFSSGTGQIEENP